MNLTKWFAAGLCLTAMTASAGFITGVATNDFEGGTLQGSWFGGVNATYIVPGTTGVADAQSPIPGVTDDKVLQLDTQGGVWTNTFNLSFQASPVWVDMLVKFVPSEELPTLTATDGKLALAIKAGAGGTNYLNFANNTGGPISWTETAKEISTSAWYRVTVKLYYVDQVGTYAQLSINGSVLGDSIPLDFDTTFNSIGFQGTGFIDEIAVNDSDPVSTAILLTLDFAAGIDSVFVGATQKTTGQTVTSGDTLVITASQWKQIATLTGPDTITWVDGGLGSSVATVTVAHASATNVAITAQTVTNTTATAGTGTSFDGAPMNKVATWALANGVTSLTSGMYDKYLFNIDDEATVPTMLITSISVSGSTVTVTVTAGASNLRTGINGTLKIRTYPTLGGAETVRTITFVGATTDTITCDIGTDKFVKATVE